MSDESTIRVLAFGSAASALGWSERAVAAGGMDRLQQLVEKLEADCPRLAAARGRMRFAINQVYAELDAPVRGGDEVALIPPVSGG